MQKVKARVQNKFNVSIAEVESLDSWKRCTLGIACVSRDKPQVERQLEKVVHFIEDLHLAEVENVHLETI